MRLEFRWLVEACRNQMKSDRLCNDFYKLRQKLPPLALYFLKLIHQLYF